MKASDLKPQQIEALKAQAARHLRWLNHLIERMDRVGFNPTDALYQSALQARAGAHALHVATHYATVKHGVARPDR